MPILPAFCDTCGTAFPSGFAFDNVFNTSLVGNRAGPCPKCGGLGHVPDGVFSFVGETIEILTAPNRTVQELTRLAEILREARESSTEPTAVASKIKKELPDFSALLQLLPTNRSEWYAFLAVILAVIQIYLAANPPAAPTSPATPAPPSITINQVIQQTLSEPPDANVARENRKKVGRNERCSCGSGLKYKKCCGKPQ